MKDIRNRNIEVQSEEVQEIMGDVPPWILRWGIIAITTVTIAFVIGCWLFKSPEIVKGDIMISSAKGNIGARMLLPDTDISKIRTGQRVKISLDRFPSTEYGYVEGIVNAISDIPGTDNKYRIFVDLPHGLVTDTNNPIPIHSLQKGQAKIVINNERLIFRFVRILDILKPYS